MKLDNIVVVVVALAVVYLVLTFYRKYRRLSDPEVKTGVCSGSCANCPFARHSSHGCRSHADVRKRRRIPPSFSDMSSKKGL